MGDGHLNKCKECTKTDVAARAASKPDAIRAYEAVRSRRPERKRSVNASRRVQYRIEPERFARYVNETNRKYPEKKSARKKVQNALIKGTLIRQSCEVCGDPNTHGHHDDYTKPLQVRWLCPTHHGEHHCQRKKILSRLLATLTAKPSWRQLPR